MTVANLCVNLQLLTLFSQIAFAKFSDAIEFKSNKISLFDNSSTPAAIEFKLKGNYQKFDGITKVYFGSDKFHMSNCVFSFTKANADKWQKMNIIGNSVFAIESTMDTFKIDAKVIQDGPNGICQSGESPIISRVFSKSHQCQAWGDPHFVALNGTKFNYQGVGDYLLLKSERLVVQAKFIQYGKTRTSVTNAVAFNYDGSSYIVLTGSKGLDVQEIQVSNKMKVKTSMDDKKGSFKA